METKEIKTYKNVSKKLKETYSNLYLNKNAIFTLKIICYTKDSINFKYYFQINKENIPIYKRGLFTTEITKIHIGIYKILLEYMKKSSFHYCTLSNNELSIIFKTNFKIIINYNNEYDKLFFEDLFQNFKRDIEEKKTLLKRI